MTTGKAASQAGHAFLDAFLQASPEQTSAYIADGGTKVVLQVPDERSLCEVYHRARMAGLPCAMVVESEHVMAPAFDGLPRRHGCGHRSMLTNGSEKSYAGPQTDGMTRSCPSSAAERPA
jgi:hypothetical protein